MTSQSAAIDWNKKKVKFEKSYLAIEDYIIGFSISLCRGGSNEWSFSPEDIVQEALLSAWRRYDRYEERGTFKAWISTSVRNCFLRKVSKASNTQRDEANYVHRTYPVRSRAVIDGGTVAKQAVDSMGNEWVASLLAQIPNSLSQVVYLRVFGELTHSEIARMLGLPSTGASEIRFRRGKDLLRKLLGGRQN